MVGGKGGNKIYTAVGTGPLSALTQLLLSLLIPAAEEELLRLGLADLSVFMVLSHVTTVAHLVRPVRFQLQKTPEYIQLQI